MDDPEAAVAAAEKAEFTAGWWWADEDAAAAALNGRALPLASTVAILPSFACVHDRLSSSHTPRSSALSRAMCARSSWSAAADQRD